MLASLYVQAESEQSDAYQFKVHVSIPRIWYKPNKTSRYRSGSSTGELVAGREAGRDWRRNTQERARSGDTRDPKDRGKLSETNIQKPPAEPEWDSVIFDASYKIEDRFYQSGFVVKGLAQENSKYDYEDGSGLHSSVYHILRPVVSIQENIERLDKTSALFTRTLTQIMRATKLLSW